jgi:TrmH family RNA methyltransferase
MGSIFALPVVPCSSEAARTWLSQRGLTTVATSPHAHRTLWEVDLVGPIAIVLGPEHTGLPPAWSAAASERVRVPMHGVADSLNVAVTGALLLFEALRQRTEPLSGRA